MSTTQLAGSFLFLVCFLRLAPIHDIFLKSVPCTFHIKKKRVWWDTNTCDLIQATDYSPINGDYCNIPAAYEAHTSSKIQSTTMKGRLLVFLNTRALRSNQINHNTRITRESNGRRRSLATIDSSP
jgi:hypothetical protein